MTDRSGLLGDPRAVLAAGLAVLVAAVVTVVSRTGNPATADTYLQDPVQAAVVLHDGRTLVATDGMRVPSGATVRTAPCQPGPCGGGRLSTAGREVYLGANSTLRVSDGVRQELLQGQAMVDSRHGPRLAVTSRAGTVRVADGALARLELGPVLRIGVFDGSARFTVTGRQATTRVPGLYQLQAPYVGFPGPTTALALRDDAWEQHLAGGLVEADQDLNRLERGLVGSGAVAVLSAVALRPAVPVPVVRQGEEALTRAVAQVAQRSGSLQGNLVTVETARAQGGSWGVVAAIAQARVSAVSALLDTLLAPPGSGPVGALPTPGVGFSFTPGPTSSSGGPPTGSPTRSPTPRPTHPSPSSSDIVQQVVGTVTGILSTPLPTGSAGLPLLP